MINTRRLITHGCSFTYGEELADPTISSWPALVASSLEIDLINLAKPAYSNDAIVEDMVDIDLDEDDLVIICWTSYIRMKFVDDEGMFTTLPRHNQIGLNRSRNELVVRILASANNGWLYRRWLSQVILMQSYLESKRCRWIFFNAFDNQRMPPKNLRNLTDKIQIGNFPGWPDQGFVEWAYGSPTGPKNHPLEQGHQAVADKLLAHIKYRYDLPKNY